MKKLMSLAIVVAIGLTVVSESFADINYVGG